MNISIAHSPDADDIFMYYSIKFGWVDTKDYIFNNIALDIETLNIKSLIGKYDVTAISFGAYPFIKNEYALLKTAISFGYGYGPKLIKNRNKNLGKYFTIALSGKYTTNAMLIKMYYPNAKPIYMNFLEIENAILNNRVDCGVLIHESILNFNKSLEVEKELWNIWTELIQDDLPLPLGGMAIRRSIPLNRAIEIESILLSAVEVANIRKKELSRKLQEDNLVRIKDDMLDKYLNMYASDKSISLSNKEILGINKLYEIFLKHNIITQKTNILDYLIPSEYLSLRHQ